VLEAAGFDRRSAARATTICQAFMFGMIGLQAQLERAQRRRRRSSPEEAYLDQLDVQGLAELGLDALLHGFQDRLARASRARTATPTRRRRTGT